MNASVIRQFHQAELVRLRLLRAISSISIPQVKPGESPKRGQTQRLRSKVTRTNNNATEDVCRHRRR